MREIEEYIAICYNRAGQAKTCYLAADKIKQNLDLDIQVYIPKEGLLYSSSIYPQLSAVIRG